MRPPYLAPALALVALLPLQAQANEFFPAQRGSAWLETVAADPLIAEPHPADGETKRVAVDRTFFGWRHLTDFIGLGPLWVHNGVGNRIYTWNGFMYELLFDFDGPTGYVESLHTVNLPGARVSAWVSRKGQTITTLFGEQQDCIQVHLDVLEPNNQSRGISAWFARGEGLVRWSEDFWTIALPYHSLDVNRDLEAIPAAPLADRILLPSARDAVVRGNRALVAAGLDGVQVVDLRDGSITHTEPVPSGAARISFTDNVASVTASDGTIHQYFVEERGGWFHSEMPPSISLPGALVDWIDTRHVMMNGSQVQIRPPLWGTTTVALPPLGAYGYWHYGVTDGTLYLPGAYPGAVNVIDPVAGTLVESIPVRDWLHDVKVIGRKAFLAGDFFGLGVLDLDTRVHTELSAESTRLLLVQDDVLHALTDRSILRYDAAANPLPATPLPSDLASTTSLRVESGRILRVDSGRALVLVQGVGLGWVTLN